MTEIQKSKPYSPQLDAIKAVAIVMIAAFHFFGELAGWHIKIVDSAWLYQYWQNIKILDVARFFEAYLYLGVNLFVIASGFGLYLSYAQSQKRFDFKQYFKKRIFRLMPAALLSVVFVFLLKGFFLDHWPLENWYVNIFPFLFGLNLFSDQWFYPPINGETWFLGLVIQLYLFFPFLSILLKKIGTRQAGKFLWIMFAVTVIFRIFYYLVLKNHVGAMGYGFSLGRIFEFSFGMVLAKNVIEKSRPLSSLWILGLALLPGYFYGATYSFTDALLGVAIFTLIWKCIKKNRFHEFFKRIAAQSYMIFLIHHPIIWILQKHGLDNPWSISGLALFIAFFTVTYFLAKILNLLLMKIVNLFFLRPGF